MSKSTGILLGFTVVAVIGVVVFMTAKKQSAGPNYGFSLNLGNLAGSLSGLFKGDKVTAAPANAYEVKGNELYVPGSNTPLEYGPF